MTATSYKVGDTVSAVVPKRIDGKIVYVGSVTRVMQVQDSDGVIHGSIFPEHVKRHIPAPPPEPPLGSIIEHFGYRWIRQPDGWHSIEKDGTVKQYTSPGARWETFSHDGVKVVLTGKGVN